MQSFTSPSWLLQIWVCSIIEHVWLLYVFFFQAEDGIRDVAVTGVQTCALPIFSRAGPSWASTGEAPSPFHQAIRRAPATSSGASAILSMAGAPPWRTGSNSPRGRSEKRRGGEKGRTRWAPDH